MTSYREAKAEYDEAMREMKRVTKRVAAASAAMTRAAQTADPSEFGTDSVVNISNGNVGVQFGTVTGGMSFNGSQSVVGGRIINNGRAKTCSTCGGQSGWLVRGGETYHTGSQPNGYACGARQ